MTGLDIDFDLGKTRHIGKGLAVLRGKASRATASRPSAGRAVTEALVSVLMSSGNWCRSSARAEVRLTCPAASPKLMPGPPSRRTGMSFGEAAGRAVASGGAYDGHDSPTTSTRSPRSPLKPWPAWVVVSPRRVPVETARPFHMCRALPNGVDVETGMYKILDFLAVADAGVVVHPRAFGGQLLGRSMLGIGSCRPEMGVRPTLRTAAGQAVLPHQAADDTRCAGQDAMGRPGHPGPGDAGGRRGIGEPPTGRMPVSLTALMDALGDDVFRRAPVTADVILASLEAGRPVQDGLAADVYTGRRIVDAAAGDHMAIVRDIMPQFELFQPATAEDALELLAR